MQIAKMPATGSLMAVAVAGAFSAGMVFASLKNGLVGALMRFPQIDKK